MEQNQYLYFSPLYSYTDDFLDARTKADISPYSHDKVFPLSFWLLSMF